MSFTKQAFPTEFPVIEQLRSVINGLRVTGQMTDREIIAEARRTLDPYGESIASVGESWPPEPKQVDCGEIY